MKCISRNLDEATFGLLPLAFAQPLDLISQFLRGLQRGFSPRKGLAALIAVSWYVKVWNRYHTTFMIIVPSNMRFAV